MRVGRTRGRWDGVAQTCHDDMKAEVNDVWWSVWGIYRFRMIRQSARNGR